MSDLAPRPRRFPWPLYWVLFALIGIIGILPLFTTIFAAAISDANGCTISESLLNPCIINGQDWGYWLQFGGMSFLYIFVTFPAALVLVIVWLIVLLVHRAGFKRRSKVA
jgi:hypothetical protein